MVNKLIPILGLFIFTGLMAQTVSSEMTPLIFSGEQGRINLLSETGAVQFACDDSQVCLIDESGEFLGKLGDNGRIQFEKSKSISIQLFDEEEKKVGFITRTGRIIINKECGKVDLIGAEDCKLCTFDGNFFTVHPEGEALFGER
jgi:hypothetical protein